PESIRQSRARLSRTAGARFSEGLLEGAEPTSGTSFTGVPAEPATRGIDRVGPRQLRQSATDRWVDRRRALKQFNPSLRAMVAQQLGRDQSPLSVEALVSGLVRRCQPHTLFGTGRRLGAWGGDQRRARLARCPVVFGCAERRILRAHGDVPAT